jgi:hypothetical protein
LDCSRLHTSPRLGILTNGFSDALVKLPIEHENLYVLTSAAPDQVGWMMPDKGASAFAYCVSAGLAGLANDDGDKKVTLGELAKYVRGEVYGAVRDRHRAAQTPMLLPERAADEAAQLALTWFNPEMTEVPTIVEDSPAVNWDEIDELWGRHYALKQGASNRPKFYRGVDLLSWEAFQQGLLRLEQLNESGAYYRDKAQRLNARLKTLADDLKRGAAEPPLPPALALARVDVEKNVEQQVKALINPGPKEPADLEVLPKIPYAKRSRAAWNRWLEWSKAPPTIQTTARDDFRRTLDDVLGAGGAPGGGGTGVQNLDPVEIRFLRLLSPLKPRAFAPAELFAGEAAALRSAIVSRDLAERAAWANDDPRVHYAVMHLVTGGDRARRQMEDMLFIEPSALSATGQPWPNAETLYKDALAFATELSTALDARDRAWQELPYYAQWLALSRETDANPSDVDSRLAKCKVLFDENRKLATAIDAVMQKCLARGGASSESLDGRLNEELGAPRKELREATVAVQNHLGELDRFRLEAIRDALVSGADEVLNLRRIRDLLSTPLVTASPPGEGNRRELRDTLLRSRRNVDALAERKSSKREDDKPPPTSVALKDHPLVALFPDEAATLASGGERLPGKLRESLQKKFGSFRSLLPEARDAANDSKAAVQRDARMMLAKAESDMRELAALWTLNPVYRESERRLHDPPILASINQFDRHHAILWQASRALDDFWGSEGGPSGQQYFAALAELALQVARGLEPGERGAEYQRIRDLRAERARAAEKWAQLTVPPVKLPAQRDASRAVETQPVIEPDLKTPLGQAAIVASQPNANAWQRRMPAPLDKKVGQLTILLPENPGDLLLSPWPVALFYRGHVFPTELRITRDEPGQVFQLVRETPAAPSIIVRGEKGDPGGVTFIFDCSGSMGTPVPEQNNIIPMPIARPALRDVLGELAADGRYRVSLWFYGHRVSWHLAANRPMTICEFLGDRSRDAILGQVKRVAPDWCNREQLRLSEDAQLVWPAKLRGDPPQRLPDPPTVLMPQQLGGIVDLVNTVQPFGVTPLYYSMVQALEKDPNLQVAGATRRLIVLTDGKNNVDDSRSRQTPTDDWKAKGYNDAQSVVRAMRDKAGGIDLAVIGFGQEVQAKGNKGGNAAPTAWPDQTSRVGSYYAVRDIQRLKEVIRTALGLKKYRVTQGDEVDEERPVNQEVVLDGHRGRLGYMVEVAGIRKHELVLEGGEAIELEIAGGQSANPRLVHARYTDQQQRNATASILSDGAARAPSPEKRYVGFQRTLREPGVVVFPISIQNDDEELFSERPAEAWVEITPVVPGAPDAKRPLLFYDLKFDDGRPVPVLLCRAINWPADATRARINLFFKLRPTETTRRLQVREVDRTLPSSELDVHAARGKVQFSVEVSQAQQYDGSRVTVTEYCDSEADLRQAKVQMDPPADIVARRTFHSPDQHRVEHEFIYKGKRTEEVRSHRVVVTSRKELEDRAFHLVTPVEVTVDSL